MEPTGDASAATDDGMVLVDAAPPDPDACWAPALDGGVEIPDANSIGCTTYDLPVAGNPARCGLTPLGCGPLVAAPAGVCESLCHHAGASCAVNGDASIACVLGVCGGGCGGRRPPGLTLELAGGRGGVGLWFAELAAREEASVAAFEILAAELMAHGAPRRLIAAARRAARDEVRHTRLMTAFAVRHGGRPRKPSVRRAPVRSLEEIAIDNAAEGCVRETFGALVGMWQSMFAGDQRLRRAMKGVARDEGGHAALSWDIARWIEPRLDAKARERVELARMRAVRELEAEALGEPAPELTRLAGVPAGASTRRLLAHARSALWERRSAA